jgi:alkanesulfonate monooxygenase SsuD/methylene tetrahydromethanopterin reductase-like flavin-dependent oxidoreductase (luciferase family)
MGDARSPEDDRTSVRLGISIGDDITIARQRTVAQDVEAAGLASLWTNDALGRDPMLVCQAWLECTSRLQAGIGIVQLLTRTAPQIAKAAATLQELSGGRLLLGLGVSQPGTMQSWHGVTLRRPLSATRDALEIIRKIGLGETTSHAGPVLSSHGFRLDISPLPPPAPLYIGAMGPGMLALAGTHADGVLLSWESPAGVERAAAAVRAAAGGAGRACPEIAAYVRVAIAADRGAARAALARQIAAYWTYYAEHFAHQGLESAVAAGTKAYESGGVESLVKSLDEALVAALGWYGTAGDDIRPFLDQFEAAGLDHFIARLVPVGDPLASLDTLLSALS